MKNPWDVRRQRVDVLPFPARKCGTSNAHRVRGPERSRLLVDASYDAFARKFGTEAGLPLSAYRDGTAGFVPVREPINRGYTVTANGKQVPFESVETGRLRYGNGNPDAAAYDSLTDVHVGDDAVECRLPWILLNVADPSSKQRLATDWDPWTRPEYVERLKESYNVLRRDL